MTIVRVLKLGKWGILMQLQFCNYKLHISISVKPMNLSRPFLLMVTPLWKFIYLSRSIFCSRWSCLFSNITAAWIAPVNSNALQLHCIYSPRDRNLFCKWERKDMCGPMWRFIGLTISLTHRNKSFPLPPKFYQRFYYSKWEFSTVISFTFIQYL